MAARSQEAARLAHDLRKQGFDVHITGSGHYEVTARGERVTTFSYSPGDRRWKQNAMRYIRQWQRAKRGNRPAGAGS